MTWHSFYANLTKVTDLSTPDYTVSKNVQKTINHSADILYKYFEEQTNETSAQKSKDLGNHAFYLFRKGNPNLQANDAYTAFKQTIELSLNMHENKNISKNYNIKLSILDRIMPE